MSSPKVDLVIEMVKELIQSGRLRAGDRLPNEAELAARLGVSRNSMREAVRAMQTTRILEAHQGDGTYVSDLDPAAMIEVLRFAVDVSDTRGVVWYLEIRRLLEVAAVQEVAVRRTPEQLARLEEVHARLMTETDAPTMMTLDGAFHDLLAELGGNPVQAALIRLVSAPTVRARVWRQRLLDRDYSRIRHEHETVMAAIRQRDVEGARGAMWLHLSDVIAWVKANPDAVARVGDPPPAAEDMPDARDRPRSRD